MYMQWFEFLLSETFIFLLLCMLIVDHDFETNENEIQTRGKIEPTRILKKSMFISVGMNNMKRMRASAMIKGDPK